MIDMNCPRCGAGGRVPRDKINARLVCKKCLQVFHLTPTLNAVIGEPPPPKKGAAKQGPAKVGEPRERVEIEIPGLSGVGEKLAKIKLPDAKTMGIVAGVLLVVGLLSWLFSKQSIEQRSNALVKAIRRGDLESGVAMALPGTEMDAMTWLIDAHKQYLDVKMAIGNFDPGAKVQVQSSSGGSGGQTLIEFSREGATSSGPIAFSDDLAPPTPGKKQSLQMVIFWSMDTWGNWRFDATRTAENASRPG